MAIESHEWVGISDRIRRLVAVERRRENAMGWRDTVWERVQELLDDCAGEASTDEEFIDYCALVKSAADVAIEARRVEMENAEDAKG